MKFLQWYVFANSCVLIFWGSLLKINGNPSKFTLIAGMLNFCVFVIIIWYRSKVNSKKKVS